MPDNSIHVNAPTPDFSGFAASSPKAVPAPLTTSQIADAVTDGILQAFAKIGVSLSYNATITDDERQALDRYHELQAKYRRDAKRHVAVGERQTYNVTR